ncbi:hypothetical protein [Spirosoma telluris]|uniref:WD40 repeat domain-containing protein n=1 Tax=Spirosoma telluris TaxID=2183553 RepID=UPI002FC393ED
MVIRETSTGNTLKTLVGHTGTVNAIAVSPDNKTVSSFGNDYIIRIWDVATGTLLRNISTNNIYISNLAISPDGQYLVGTGGTIYMCGITLLPRQHQRQVGMQWEPIQLTRRPTAQMGACWLRAHLMAN